MRVSASIGRPLNPRRSLNLMLLHEILDFAVVRDPGGTALAYGDESWTFRELRERVDAVAAGIQAIAQPGDRVAFLAENVPEYVECYYAVPKAGMVLTVVNYRLHEEEWARTLDHAQATVLVGERALLDRALEVRDQFPTVTTLVCVDDPVDDEVPYADLVASVHDFEPVEARSDTDTAWLLYTSGTTGRAKGAMLTHRSLVAACTATALARPIEPADVYLYPFPLCHIAGYNVLLFHLHARPIVLMRRFDVEGWMEAVARHRATNTSLAPTMISMVLDDPGLPEADLSSLRSIGYGASGIPAAVLRRGLDVLGVDFAQGYGMTELSGNAAFLDPESHRRGAAAEGRLLRAAGRPSPLVAVRVVDDDMNDVPPGEAGEIVVRGDQVTVGYWRDPEATSEAFAGGWFHTGDLGRFDDEGYLYVVDRKKDVVVSGGENVASREVEDVLHRHPEVKEAAVIGVPDERWGEAVTAVVVRREGEDGESCASDELADELIELCREHLAGFKKPRHVVFVGELPKNHSGKILKRALRETVPDLLADR